MTEPEKGRKHKNRNRVEEAASPSYAPDPAASA